MEYVDNSPMYTMYQSLLFSRIVPCVRDIGLWGDKVQSAYADMGVLERREVDLDALMKQDEDIAEQIDRAAQRRSSRRATKRSTRPSRSAAPPSRRRADQAGASFGRPRFRVCWTASSALVVFRSSEQFSDRRPEDRISDYPLLPQMAVHVVVCTSVAAHGAPEIVCRGAETRAGSNPKSPGETMNRSAQEPAGRLRPRARRRARRRGRARARRRCPDRPPHSSTRTYAAAAPVGRALPRTSPWPREDRRAGHAHGRRRHRVRASPGTPAAAWPACPPGPERDDRRRGRAEEPPRIRRPRRNSQ